MCYLIKKLNNKCESLNNISQRFTPYIFGIDICNSFINIIVTIERTR